MRLFLFTLIISFQIIGQTKTDEVTDTMDTEFKKLIESLIRRDQKVRVLKYSKAEQYILKCSSSNEKINPKKLKKSHSLMKEWIEVDSLNSLALIKAIKKRGFPSEIKVGEASHNRAITLLIHFGLHSPDQVLQPILDSALSKQEISSSAYAYITDCQKVRFKKDQLYCQYLPFKFENMTKTQKDLVLVNRKKIGLTSVSYRHEGKSKLLK